MRIVIRIAACDPHTPPCRGRGREETAARAQVTDDRVASVDGRKEGATDSFLPRPWEGREERAANSFLPLLQGGGLRWESSSYSESIISRWDHVRRPRT
jgi:hypothetical protein